MLTPLSSQVLCLRPGKRGGNREKEGLEEERKEERDEEEKERGLEVKGGGSPQPDSRRQNVSRLQRRSMLCMQPNPTENLYSLVIEKEG